jgi:hypothetical protein
VLHTRHARDDQTPSNTCLCFFQPFQPSALVIASASGGQLFAGGGPLRGSHRTAFWRPPLHQTCLWFELCQLVPCRINQRLQHLIARVEACTAEASSRHSIIKGLSKGCMQVRHACPLDRMPNQRSLIIARAYRARTQRGEAPQRVGHALHARHARDDHRLGWGTERYMHLLLQPTPAA